MATRVPPGHANRVAGATPGRGASANAPGHVNRAGAQPGQNQQGVQGQQPTNQAANNPQQVVVARGGGIPTIEVPGGGLQQANLGNLAQPAQALHDAGLVQQGVNPSAVLQEIVNNLRGLGYNPNQQQDLAGQLRETLSQLQERSGLQQTGQLDRQTMDTLVRLGALREPRHTTTDKPTKDNYEVARNRDFITEISNPRARAQDNESKQRTFLSFLGGLLRGLGGARGKGGGDTLPAQSAGANKGADADAASKGAPTEPAARPTQAPPKPEPVKFARGIQTTRDAAKAAEPARPQNVEPRTTQQSQERPAQPVQPRASADARTQAGADASAGRAQSQSPSLGQSATSPPTVEQARSATLTAQQDPTAKGLPEAKGDPRAVQGQGQTVGEAAARYDIGMMHAGSILEAQGTDGDYHEYEEGATERDHGGSTSGEERSDDPERGHAQLDDGSEAGPGHYKVPPISWQIAQALRAITRDPDESNRATTYSWDLTLFKPAIYGAGQKATPLFHLVVVSADPFDPVWERAREELTRHLLRLEPEAEIPELEDFQSALRRARVADPPPPERATLQDAPPTPGEET